MNAIHTSSWGVWGGLNRGADMGQLRRRNPVMRSSSDVQREIAAEDARRAQLQEDLVYHFTVAPLAHLNPPRSTPAADDSRAQNPTLMPWRADLWRVAGWGYCAARAAHRVAGVAGRWCASATP